MNTYHLIASYNVRTAEYLSEYTTQYVAIHCRSIDGIHQVSALNTSFWHYNQLVVKNITNETLILLKLRGVNAIKLVVNSDYTSSTSDGYLYPLFLINGREVQEFIDYATVS